MFAHCSADVALEAVQALCVEAGAIVVGGVVDSSFRTAGSADDYEQSKQMVDCIADSVVGLVAAVSSAPCVVKASVEFVKACARYDRVLWTCSYHHCCPVFYF